MCDDLVNTPIFPAARAQSSFPAGRTYFSRALILALIAEGTALHGVEAGQRPPAPPKRIELRSASLLFVLDAVSLSPVRWQNLIARTSLDLRGGCELEVEVGDKLQQARKVVFQPAGAAEVSPKSDRAVLHFQSSDHGLAATLVYQIDPRFPVLRKFVELANTGQQPLRVLNVVLGRYPVQVKAEGGDRGFPLYLGDEHFVSLAHPAGFARLENGQAVLRQYPGARLVPGGKLQCMEAVYGVARPGDARAAFVAYVRSRMRRVLRGHDKPYAVLESFGGQPGNNYWTTEKYLLEHLGKVAQSRREGGPQFDIYAIEFWHDTAGDLTTFQRKNFPNGFQKVRDEIRRLGMSPGLWIDSGGQPEWSIRDNPTIRSSFNFSEGVGALCRASEPINSMYKKAFIHHIRENHVRLLKFDNLGWPPGCVNLAHAHLPRPLYSVEAIHNGIIDFLQSLDAECPDVFMILYWGYRSPWWLPYAEMYFESGRRSRRPAPPSFRPPMPATASRSAWTRPSGGSSTRPGWARTRWASGFPPGRGMAASARRIGRRASSWTSVAAASWPRSGPIPTSSRRRNAGNWLTSSPS